MFQFHRSSSVVIVAVLLAACDDQLTQPPSPTDAEFTILDGARGGDPQFFFLPPMVSAPTYSGTFDATQSPIVQICELAGSTCGATVASFTGGAVKVDLEKEAYVATWKTKGAGLDPAKTYRIEVLIGTSVLGYADVVVLSNGSQIKTVDKNQFVATINGGVLNIRFRIETAPPPPPPPPPPGVWQNGDLVTYTQADWGDATTTAGILLADRFNTLYGALGYVEVGIPGAGGFSMKFTSAGAVFTYQPASGVPAPLNADLLDPTSTASGVFGGEVLALRLNVDLSDAGFLSGTTNIDIGNLTLCRLAQGGLNGTTVRTFQDVANAALGGGSTPYAIADLNAIAANINGSFAAGVPSSFAQDHLVNGACPTVWQNGDLVTYSQESWGGDPATSAAAALLLNRFDFRYPGGMFVGLLGAAGFSMTFTSATAIRDFLPASGVYGALNNDLVNPTSSASGAFGGYLLGLQLSIDFTDSGDIVGAAGLAFGGLRLCGLMTMPAFNNLTVRQFLVEMNSVLGGGPWAYTLDDMANLTNDVSLAFEAGVPSSFAQAHLVNGACP